MRTRPNILIVETESSLDKPNARELAQSLTDDAYVYLAEPGRRDVEDCEAGVRYIPDNTDGIKRFGDIDLVIVVNDEQTAREIKNARESSPVVVWDTEKPARRIGKKNPFTFPSDVRVPDVIQFLQALNPGAWRSAI